VDLTGFLTSKYILCLFTTRDWKVRHIKTITTENIINDIVIPWAHIGYEMVDRLQVGYNYVSFNIEICNDRKLAIQISDNKFARSPQWKHDFVKWAAAYLCSFSII